jgi:hypothetical protein
MIFSINPGFVSTDVLLAKLAATDVDTETTIPLESMDV